MNTIEGVHLPTYCSRETLFLEQMRIPVNRRGRCCRPASCWPQTHLIDGSSLAF
jgi:hypothetical protein